MTFYCKAAQQYLKVAMACIVKCYKSVWGEARAGEMTLPFRSSVFPASMEGSSSPEELMLSYLEPCSHSQAQRKRKAAHLLGMWFSGYVNSRGPKSGS